MDLSKDTLTIKYIMLLAHMQWSITICSDNTTEHLYYVMVHDGFDTELSSTGNDLNILIDNLYNRIIKCNW